MQFRQNLLSEGVLTVFSIRLPNGTQGGGPSEPDSLNRRIPDFAYERCKRGKIRHRSTARDKTSRPLFRLKIAWLVTEPCVGKKMAKDSTTDSTFTFTEILEGKFPNAPKRCKLSKCRGKGEPIDVAILSKA